MAAVLFLILMALSGVASAQTPGMNEGESQCYTYSATYGGKVGTGYSPDGAASALVAALNVGPVGSCPTAQMTNDVYSVKSATTSTAVLGHNRINLNYEPTGQYIPGTSNPEYACRDRSQVQADKVAMMGRVPGECAPPERDLDAECKTWAVQSTVSGGWAFNETPYALAGKLESGTKCMDPGPAQELPQGTGCKMDFERTMAAQGADGNWTTYGFFTPPGSYGSQGGSCTLPTGSVPSVSTPTVPPINCAGGKVPAPGEVNGQTTWYCASPTKSESSQRTSTTTGPSGTASTTKVTECTGAFCTTTTTTTTNTSGSSTSTQTSTVTQSKSAFCESSPNDAQCKGIRPGTDTGTQSGGSTGGGGSGGDGEEGGSSFGGACAAGFSCEGDAIQCAIAKEQHLKNCKFWEGESPERTLFTTEAARSGNVTGDNPNNSTGNVGPGSFDTTNALGTQASCIADRTVTVMGASVTLPFSAVCQYLAMLGNVLMGVSMLLAARIVMRG